MTTMSGPRPTLDDVAAAVGVSKATVSKVVNGRPRISPGTRQRVMAAVEELGYVRTATARVSASVPSMSVVFRTFSDIYTTRVLEGVIMAGHQHGVEVVADALDLAEGDHQVMSPSWLRAQAARQRTGLILVTIELTAAQRKLIAQLGLAVVHIDPINPLVDETISVGSTNYTGGTQAVQHLVNLGHRRIAYAGGPTESVPARERLQAYLATITAVGVDPAPELQLMEDHKYESGLLMGERLLALDDPPTAIFAGSDSIALGVLEAARRHGVRVPVDLSIVGFDDTYAATSATPALTTVRQPLVEMGRVAMRTVLQLDRGEAMDSPHVQLSTQLVVRASTAPPAH